MPGKHIDIDGIRYLLVEDGLVALRLIPGADYTSHSIFFNGVRYNVPPADDIIEWRSTAWNKASLAADDLISANAIVQSSVSDLYPKDQIASSLGGLSIESPMPQSAQPSSNATKSDSKSSTSAQPSSAKSTAASSSSAPTSAKTTASSAPSSTPSSTTSSTSASTPSSSKPAPASSSSAKSAAASTPSSDDPYPPAYTDERVDRINAFLIKWGRQKCPTPDGKSNLEKRGGFHWMTLFELAFRCRNISLLKWVRKFQQTSPIVPDSLRPFPLPFTYMPNNLPLICNVHGKYWWPEVAAAPLAFVVALSHVTPPIGIDTDPNLTKAQVVLRFLRYLIEVENVKWSKPLEWIHVAERLDPAILEYVLTFQHRRTAAWPYFTSNYSALTPLIIENHLTIAALPRLDTCILDVLLERSPTALADLKIVLGLVSENKIRIQDLEQRTSTHGRTPVYTALQGSYTSVDKALVVLKLLSGVGANMTPITFSPPIFSAQSLNPKIKAWMESSGFVLPTQNFKLVIKADSGSSQLLTKEVRIEGKKWRDSVQNLTVLPELYLQRMLEDALLNGDVEAAAKWMARGAQLVVCDRGFYQIDNNAIFLYELVRRERLESLKFLHSKGYPLRDAGYLKRGLDTHPTLGAEIVNDYYPIVFEAVRTGNIEMVKWLREVVMCPWTVSDITSTGISLYCAAVDASLRPNLVRSGRHLLMLEYLWEQRVSPIMQGSPLIHAVSIGAFDALKWLHDHEVPPAILASNQSTHDRISFDLESYLDADGKIAHSTSFQGFRQTVGWLCYVAAASHNNHKILNWFIESYEHKFPPHDEQMLLTAASKSSTRKLLGRGFSMTDTLNPFDLLAEIFFNLYRQHRLNLPQAYEALLLLHPENPLVFLRDGVQFAIMLCFWALDRFKDPDTPKFKTELHRLRTIPYVELSHAEVEKIALAPPTVEFMAINFMDRPHEWERVCLMLGAFNFDFSTPCMHAFMPFGFYESYQLSNAKLCSPYVPMFNFLTHWKAAVETWATSGQFNIVPIPVILMYAATPVLRQGCDNKYGFENFLKQFPIIFENENALIELYYYAVLTGSRHIISQVREPTPQQIAKFKDVFAQMMLQVLLSYDFDTFKYLAWRGFPVSYAGIDPPPVDMFRSIRLNTARSVSKRSKQNKVNVPAHMNFYSALIIQKILRNTSTEDTRDELIEAFDLLASLGADINEVDANKCTPADYAARLKDNVLGDRLAFYGALRYNELTAQSGAKKASSS